MVAKLIAEEGLLRGLSFDLEDREEWTIGRDPDACQLVIEDPSVSRQHAVCRKKDDSYELENLSQTNPTLINDKPIDGPRILNHGDKIGIGNEVFTFYSKTETEVDHLATLEEEFSPSEEEIEAAIPPPEPEPEEPGRASIFEENEAEEEEKRFAEIDLDLTETNQWILKVIAGPNNGAEFAMEPGKSYVLGNDPSTCDIVFQDVSVSRQHAKITLGPEEGILIEDLGSSNGTLIEGEKIEGSNPLPSNTIVSCGTTSFIVYNLEGERETVISPLLPGIVKILKEEEQKRYQEEQLEKKERLTEEERPASAPPPPPPPPQKTNRVLLIFLGIFLIFIVLGITQLFRPQEIEKPQVDPAIAIEQIMEQHPSITYSYTKETGRLLLVGHVLSAVDRNQLLYRLNILPSIKTIEDRIIVDEFIWSEMNQVLAKNPNWRGISMNSPAPGRYVISGYLDTRQQAENLNDYLNQNFPYIDLLERRIIVEENLRNQIQVLLQDNDFEDIALTIDDGEITLEGTVSSGSRAAFNEVVNRIRQINGVRNVKAFVAERPAELSIVNISDRYRVTGSSTQGRIISVVINGRFLTVGDTLDGMTITQITPDQILLERGETQYVIDY
ncbi:MAG: hypothetical protein Tsb0021_12810 [Chlamydiales bacterium]